MAPSPAACPTSLTARESRPRSNPGTLGDMAQVTMEVVDGKVRYDGRTLSEWVPDVVEVIVGGFSPRRIVLFGSVARGDDGPDSDIDLIIVFDELPPERHLEMIRELLCVGSLAPPVDVLPIDEAALWKRGSHPGLLRAALREGHVVYDRR